MNEGLDKNQKRAGQLGPTEKVGKNGPRGKLVGANESFINTDAQAVVSEMDSQGYKGTRDSDDEGGKGEGKATPVKAKDVVKKGAKALDKAMDKAHPDYNKHEKKLISKMMPVCGWKSHIMGIKISCCTTKFTVYRHSG